MTLLNIELFNIIRQTAEIKLIKSVTHLEVLIFFLSWIFKITCDQLQYLLLFFSLNYIITIFSFNLISQLPFEKYQLF